MSQSNRSDAAPGESFGPIVSSAHLADGAMPALSEVEFGMILAGHAFERWMERCMTAAGLPGLTATEILVLHTRHTSRQGQAPRRHLPRPRHRGHASGDLCDQEARGQGPRLARKGRQGATGDDHRSRRSRLSALPGPARKDPRCGRERDRDLAGGDVEDRPSPARPVRPLRSSRPHRGEPVGRGAGPAACARRCDAPGPGMAVRQPADRNAPGADGSNACAADAPSP